MLTKTDHEKMARSSNNKLNKDGDGDGEPNTKGKDAGLTINWNLVLAVKKREQVMKK